MKLQEAILKSNKGTAIREVNLEDGSKKKIIGYLDGSGFCLFSRNGKVDFTRSREAMQHEMHHQDWKPSN